MKGITVLITFIFLLVINTLSAQSEANFSNNGEIDIGLVDAGDGVYFSDTTSLKRRKQTGIAVYPSPAKDDINIQRLHRRRPFV